jgi:polysaccharide biosynthesis protein PelG
MAGIGFRLRRLSEQDNLLAPVASIGHATVIATGPWLFTVIALALINMSTAARVATPVIEGFRLLAIYAFAISLVATTPIVIVAMRLVGDAIYLRAYARISSLFMAALLMSGAAATIAPLLIYTLIFPLPLHLLVAGVSTCAIVGLIWVGLAFCGAVRNYRAITFGFLIGLCVSVVGTVAAVMADLHAAGMLWAFNAGLMVIFCCLASQVLTTFSKPVTEFIEPLGVLTAGMRRFWRLSLGGLVSAVAIWIDKWVVWLGPAGVVHETGLIHAPLYDSAMFIAYLAIIPALSLFVTHIETTFFEKYRHYYKAISNHATLRQIEQNAKSLEQVTVRTLTHIILVQAVLCAIVVLGAPSVIEATGLHYQQISVLRFGALGALFQFVFLAASALLLFFERHAQFLMLQTLFLVLQGVLTAITVELGTDYYGLGNLVVCVVCGSLALAMLEHTMRHLTFITFIFNSVKSTAVTLKSPAGGLAGA